MTQKIINNGFSPGDGTGETLYSAFGKTNDNFTELYTTKNSLGTISTQNANNVAITGGAVDGTTVGATTQASGKFTTLESTSTGSFGTASANYWQATGGATTNAIQFQALGTDANISQVFQPKGTGAFDIAAGSKGINISNGGTVTAITRTATGSGYSTPPTIAIAAPTTAGGVQATATCVLVISSATIAGGGTGYTQGDVLTVSGGTFTTAATITVSTVSGGVITAVTVSNAGNYTVAPTSPVSVTGGTGSGATFNLTVIVGSSFTITNAGSGYVEQPTVTFSGGGGSGTAAYATVGSGTTVQSIGNTMSFRTPGGEAFRVSEAPGGGGTTVNFVQAQGRTAGSNPVIRSAGSDAAIGLSISSKSTSPISFLTNDLNQEQFRVSHTASAVNYVQVTGSVTNPAASALGSILFTGSDTNVNGSISVKGTGYISFSGGGATNSQAFRILTNNASSSGNLIAVQGAAANSAPSIQAISGSAGTDANIDLALTPKGTGVVQFGTRTATSDVAITGYITIKDSGGTTRKLAIID